MSNKKLFWYIVGTVLFIIVFSSPFLWRIKVDPSKNIDAEKFSQYGSYIGGLIGASCSGLSLLLLILTYRNQLSTDERNKQSMEVDGLNKRYEMLVSDIDNLSYEVHRGVEVFYKINLQSLDDPQGVLDQLNALLHSFRTFIDDAKSAPFQTEKEKDIVLTRVYFLYYSKVLWPVHARIWTKLRSRLQETHDDSPYYFKTYKILSLETIEYLAAKKLVNSKKDHFTA